MKIKKEKITRENTMLSHAILETITDSIIQKGDIPNKDEIEITLMIEGEEVDVTKFFNHLENQWDSNVRHEAQKLIEENDIIRNKMNSITDSLSLIENHMTNLVKELKIEE
jgi:hypothetical protein